MYLDPDRPDRAWDTIPSGVKVTWPAMATTPESTGPAPPPEEDHQEKSSDELAEAGDERAGNERVGAEDERVDQAGTEQVRCSETTQAQPPEYQNAKTSAESQIAKESSKSPEDKHQSTNVVSPMVHSPSRQMSKGDADERLRDDRMRNNEDTRPKKKTTSPNTKSFKRRERFPSETFPPTSAPSPVQEPDLRITAVHRNSHRPPPPSSPPPPAMDIEEVFNDVGDPNVVIPQRSTDLNDFNNIAVFTHIDLIQEPEFATRYIEEQHVDNMKAALRNGYTASAGALAVSIPPASLQLAKDVKPGQQLPFKTILVDGRHRLHALRFLRDNQTEDGLDWKAITSRLEVRLYIHKQEIPVDNFMTIALGQRLNSSTTVSLPTKFRARIEAGINSLLCLAKDMNLEVRQLPIEECAKTILRSGNIGDLSRQTTTRYTAI